MTEQRWHLRLDNLREAVNLLDEGLRIIRDKDASVLMGDGVVQRFEFTWELAWKTIRDFLQEEGAGVPVTSSIGIIRAAASVGLIDDPDLWVNAQKDRNLSSHEYVEERIVALLGRVEGLYLQEFRSLVDRLDRERQRGD